MDNKNKLVINRFVNFVFVSLSVFVLLIPALQNGYPLLYSDSATYIASGHIGAVPIDRPMLYCFMVRHLSLSYSLWLVVIFQSVIFVWLTSLMLAQFVESRFICAYSFVVCLFLSLFTGASNYLSQIMPDVFSGFLIAALGLILISRNKTERRILTALTIVSSMVHFSNLLTITGLSIVSLILLYIFKKRVENIRTKAVNLVVISVLPWMLIPSFNFLFEKEFYLNKSSNVFFTGRLIETKILSDFFETQPNAKQYSLYAVKDRVPEKAWQFLWNNDSPLYDGNCSANGGWSNCWKVHSPEYGRMIRDVLTTPALLEKFVRISMADWKNQLLDFDTGHLTPQGKGSGFDEIIPQYLDDSLQYRAAKQYTETLFFEKESKIQRWVVGISLVVIVCSVIYLARKKSDNIKSIVIIGITILFGLIINALSCSVFSGVLNRYQGRVIWLIPLFALTLVLILFQVKATNRKAGLGTF